MDQAKNDRDLPVYLFHEGTNHRAWQLLGAHPARRDGAEGWTFRTWAPAAAAVDVVGDFNDWQPGQYPMEMRPASRDLAALETGPDSRVLDVTLNPREGGSMRP